MGPCRPLTTATTRTSRECRPSTPPTLLSVPPRAGSVPTSRTPRGSVAVRWRTSTSSPSSMDSTPLIVGVILTFGFLLLLVAPQAPLIALLGTHARERAVHRSRVRRGSPGLPGGLGSGPMGLESQGFLDAFLVRLVPLPPAPAPHRTDPRPHPPSTPPPRRSSTMCRPTKCRTCGKTTWAGCGQHVAQVKASVPPGHWCPGHPKAEGQGGGGGLMSRLFGRG